MWKGSGAGIGIGKGTENNNIYRFLWGENSDVYFPCKQSPINILYKYHVLWELSFLENLRNKPFLIFEFEEKQTKKEKEGETITWFRFPWANVASPRTFHTFTS